MVREGYKETELGEIPVDWEIGELSKYCQIILSNVDKKTNSHEIPVSLCNYMDVFNNEDISKEIEFMKASAKYNEIIKYSIQKNDVLITKDSETAEEIAISSAVIDNFVDVLCGYHLAIIRDINNKFNCIFLSKSLILPKYHRQFEISAKGVTRYGISKNTIETAQIPIPPLPEQHHIAAVLTAADNRIEKEEAYRDKLTEMKKGLMADLLSGKVRVPEGVAEV